VQPPKSPKTKTPKNGPRVAVEPGNRFVRVPLQRLSICPCGFPVLKDEIGLGTEYEIDTTKLASFTFICGGCKRKHHIIGVWVAPRDGGEPGWLPRMIFEKPK